MEEIRKVTPVEDAVRTTVNTIPATCLVDAATFQTHIKESLPKIFDYIIDRTEKRFVRTYPLDLVVKLLRQHIEDMMGQLELTELQLVNVITKPELFFGIGRIKKERRKDVLRFLATYTIISQLLFLRLFSRTSGYSG